MQSIILILAGLLLSTGLIKSKTKEGRITTPEALATFAKCSPSKISEWAGDHITYQEQEGYASATTVMTRKWGDCKGYAVVAQETLTVCKIKSHIIQLTQEYGVGHVITVFTLSDGRRGFINAGQWQIYNPGVPVGDIIKDVGDGRWVANFVEE